MRDMIPSTHEAAMRTVMREWRMARERSSARAFGSRRESRSRKVKTRTGSRKAFLHWVKAGVPAKLGGERILDVFYGVCGLGPGHLGSARALGGVWCGG